MSLQETYLQGIADAIRVKTGETGAIQASKFAEKIAAIPTGITKPAWTAATMPNAKWWDDICYGKDRFVAVASDQTNQIAYSLDGKTWVATTSPLATNLYSVCYGKDRFIAVGSNTNQGIHSFDGIKWYTFTLPSTHSWRAVRYWAGIFVAISSDTSDCAYSSNGISWSTGTMPSSAYWKALAIADDRIVALAGNSTGNTAAWSQNGKNWTDLTLNSIQYWSSVVYGNGIYVFSSLNFNNYKAVVCWTKDTLNWHTVELPDELQLRTTFLCYGGGKFILIGQGGVAAYSIDAVNWTVVSMPSSGNWNAPCYGKGVFVAARTYNSRVAAYLNDTFDEWN